MINIYRLNVQISGGVVTAAATALVNATNASGAIVRVRLVDFIPFQGQ